MMTRRRAIASSLLLALVAMFFPASTSSEPALLLYGGAGHKVFLGCLNCNKLSPSSIWNKFGTHGSKFSASSIWNRFGTYGSKFSPQSPWNQFSTTAPAVVDADGNFYGYFSANKFHPKRTTIPSLLVILDNYDWIIENLDEVLDQMN